MLKYDFIEVDICHRMEPLRMFYSLTMTYIFKAKLFKWRFWHVDAEKCKHCYCHQIGSPVFAIELRHQGWCGAIRWHLWIWLWWHYDFDLHFQCHEFWNVNIVTLCRGRPRRECVRRRRGIESRWPASQDFARRSHVRRRRSRRRRQKRRIVEILGRERAGSKFVHGALICLLP